MTKTQIKTAAKTAREIVKGRQGIKRNDLQNALGIDDAGFEMVVGSVKSFVRVRGQGGGFYI